MDRKSSHVLAAASLCLISSLSLAQTTHTIAFQGKLANAAGVPLPDGPQAVTFRLYNGPSGTFPVNGEAHRFTNDTIDLAHFPMVPDSETMKSADGSVTYVRGTDYTVNAEFGFITRVSSTTIPDGTSVVVSYQYTAAKLWEESKTVTVAGGFVSTALGDTTPFTDITVFGPSLYLGVQVGSDPEMTPRALLSSAPSLALPYADTINATGGSPAFSISNTGGGAAIVGHNDTSVGVEGLSGNSTGVVGQSTGAGDGVSGRSHSGNGVNAVSDVGAGLKASSNSGTGVDAQSGSGYAVRAQTGTGPASIWSTSAPGVGVGVAVGDKAPLGFAGFETNFSRGTTHIWCGENGHEVFAVTSGGAVCGTSFNQCSDVRLKQDIEPLRDPLASLLSLRGISFEWDPESAGRSFPQGRQIGFIAQEVEQVLPEVVSTDAGGYKSVAYANVVPVLVEAVKEQQREINALRSDLAEARARAARVEYLEARMKRMEKRLNRMERVERVERVGQTARTDRSVPRP